MKLPIKVFPLLIIKIACGQTPPDYSGNKIEYGFSNSTFSGLTINNFSKPNYISSDLQNKKPVANTNALSCFNYGWKEGVFLWINLSPCISYKPQLDATFGVCQFEKLSSKSVYSTFVGCEFKPQLIIRLGCKKTNPIIKLARNMSYYLKEKQGYLIVGPKFTHQKQNKKFIESNKVNCNSIGILFGGGIDHLFPNLNVAPELLISVEYLTGNYRPTQNNSGRYYTSLSIAMNFY